MPFDQKAYLHEYYLENKDRINARNLAAYYAKHEENKARNRAYGKAHRAESRERWNKWFHDDPSKDRNNYLMKTFGISLSQYNDMLARQGGHCAICPTTPRENRRRLAVDHDHVTKRVRGLLCHHCNIALGNARDSVERLEAMIHYLTLAKGN